MHYNTQVLYERPAPGLPRYYPPSNLSTTPPHTFYIRLTRTDWTRSILQRGYILHSQPPTITSTYCNLISPSLERQGGRVGNSINCEGHAVGPCAKGSLRCCHRTIVTPSMTRAAAGLVARRSDPWAIVSSVSNIPVFSEFHNASTKPHIPYERLLVQLVIKLSLGTISVNFFLQVVKRTKTPLIP